ncbi:MAG: phosphate acetyltransferase [Spirochaetes bacterium]|nr:phosphate acetyltransferase [Spirochaetota bacterium]
MDLIKQITEKAKSLNKKIVLPETDDDRILKAAEMITGNNIAHVILIGNSDHLKSKAQSSGVNLEGTTIIDPETSEYLNEFIEKYYQKRAAKGMTQEKAAEIMKNDKMFFGAMLVDKGVADGLVGGALNTTGHTLKAIFHCVGTLPGVRTISSFFAMISDKKEFGHNGITFFADCAVIPNPTDSQLCDIASATARNFKIFTGQPAKVAFLSFSTKGSAQTEDTEKVVSAYKMFTEKYPDILVDGELQLDAAIVPKVGEKKAPGSKVAGQANVLVFPDLDAGNIGYKLTQRFGDCDALGPILQGAAKPVNDLSRGCSVEDIVNVTAITAVQAE